MNEENYARISGWFRKKEKRLLTFILFYKILPDIVVLAYAGCILYTVISGTSEQMARIIIVPAVTFLLCTVFRKLINKKRPYEELSINPLIKKEKKGQSFPSRHMVSAAVIAMTAMYIHPLFGTCMLIIAILVGVVRPIAGVHYIKDVVAGFVMGVLCGIAGFFLI
ncbi:MAG: phosphatase PAP2 family protein [Lachnospiraceae bacterium]|nr:phosphatase PAP2 family protein [Lachnospiraceae bacterium]